MSDAQFLALERKLLSAWLAQSRADLERLFHPEFREFSAEGRELCLSEVLTSLREPVPGRIEILDHAVVPLAPDAVLATYRARSMSGAHSLRSSTWVRVDGSWRLRFHQGTRCPAGTTA